MRHPADVGGLLKASIEDGCLECYFCKNPVTIYLGTVHGSEVVYVWGLCQEHVGFISDGVGVIELSEDEVGVAQIMAS